MEGKKKTKDKSVLKYWTEAFENYDPLWCQDQGINPTSPQCALDNLKMKSWKEVKEGLRQISSYTKHRPYDLDAHRTEILKAVLGHVSKPSAVTRQAVQTLKEIVVNLTDTLNDKEWGDIFYALLAYYGVAPSKQMMEEVETILRHIIDRIPYNKSVLMLTSAFGKLKHKKSKELAAKFLKKVVVELGPYNVLTENGKIGSSVFRTVAKLLACQSNVTKYYAKKILHTLMTSEHFERFVREHVPADLLQVTIDEIHVIKEKGVGQKFKLN